MNKKLLYVFLIILLSLPSSLSGEKVRIDIDTLEIDEYYNIWQNESELTFRVEGFNISIEETLSSIIMTFNETMGRDATLDFHIPDEYIEPSVLSEIQSSTNSTVYWTSYRNETVASMDFIAFQEITLEVSKTSLLVGKTRKNVQDFWGYIEYNSYSDGNQTNVVTFINKDESSFPIDNKHVIVQYKTSFFGWYYPVSDVSSDEIYYYMDDIGDKYRVVTHFEDNASSHTKVHTFPGASAETASHETIKGTLANWWLKTTIGVKKIIIDWFGDQTPSVT